MSARSYDGRHRGSKHATARHANARQRRLLTGLALPTAAAAALTFTASGAAVVTSGKMQATSVSHTTTPLASSAATVSPAQLRDRRIQQVEDNALAIARSGSASSVARAAERKSVAARALAVKRAEAAHDWQLPITNPVRTSGFGFRWGRLHAGADFAVPVGSNLTAMSTGTVVFAGQQGGYGNLVKVRYWDGTVSFYGHMSRISVTSGERVDPGQVVGQSGNTGHSTGPHLHLEIHPDGGAAVDPLPWLAEHNIAS